MTNQENGQKKVKQTPTEYVVSGKFKEFEIKYGTQDENNAEVLYMRVRTRMSPTVKKDKYTDTVASAKENFTALTKELFNGKGDFDKRNLCEFSASEEGVSYGKKSRLRYDIFLRPKIVKDMVEYEEQMVGFADTINERIMKILKSGGIDCVR